VRTCRQPQGGSTEEEGIKDDPAIHLGSEELQTAARADPQLRAALSKLPAMQTLDLDRRSGLGRTDVDEATQIDFDDLWRRIEADED
jgi:hypothetical protein